MRSNQDAKTRTKKERKKKNEKNNSGERSEVQNRDERYPLPEEQRNGNDSDALVSTPSTPPSQFGSEEKKNKQTTKGKKKKKEKSLTVVRVLVSRVCPVHVFHCFSLPLHGEHTVPKNHHFFCCTQNCFAIPRFCSLIFFSILFFFSFLW